MNVSRGSGVLGLVPHSSVVDQGDRLGSVCFSRFGPQAFGYRFRVGPGAIWPGEMERDTHASCTGAPTSNASGQSVESVAMGGFPVDGQSRSPATSPVPPWPGFSRPRQLLAFARLITNVTKLRLDPSTVPVTSQHPSVGKMTPVAWKPLNP